MLERILLFSLTQSNMLYFIHKFGEKKNYYFFFWILLLLNLVCFLSIAVKYRYKIIEHFKRSYSIVFLGDSITKGGDWNNLLNNSDIKNSGHPGFTTSHFIVLLKKDVINYKPTTCFIQGGINDILVGIPIKRTFSNYTSIVDTLLKYRITPIVESTLYTEKDSISNKQVDSLNNFLIKLCSETHIKYIDLNKTLSSNKRLKSEYSLDGVHVNQDAYKVWASMIKK